nr:hypothetical protein CFP56_41209 [Quercus suber]
MFRLQTASLWPPLHTPSYANLPSPPPLVTLSSRYDCGCVTKMASTTGSPPSPPLQDNVDIEHHLWEAQDHLHKAIEELQICLIIGFSSQESRLTVSLF